MIEPNTDLRSNEFYLFKLSKKFVEKQKLASLNLVRKDNVSQSVNILGEKVMFIHKMYQFETLISVVYFVCVKDLCVTRSLHKRESVFMR